MRVFCCSSLRFCFLGWWVLSQLWSKPANRVNSVASQVAKQQGRHGGGGWKHMDASVESSYLVCFAGRGAEKLLCCADCWPARHLVSVDVSENWYTTVMALHGHSWSYSAKTWGDAAHEEELLVQSWFMGSSSSAFMESPAEAALQGCFAGSV